MKPADVDLVLGEIGAIRKTFADVVALALETDLKVVALLPEGDRLCFLQGRLSLYADHSSQTLERLLNFVGPYVTAQVEHENRMSARRVQIERTRLEIEETRAKNEKIVAEAKARALILEAESLAAMRAARRERMRYPSSSRPDGEEDQGAFAHLHPARPR